MKHKEEKLGRYGSYGGAYMPEGLISPLNELQTAWDRYKTDSSFQESVAFLLREYAGRPTALTEVSRFAYTIGAPRIFLKREDLLHTGAHKLNNALGQCMLAKAMGKKRIVAETGAGQHGVAAATACARLGLDCVVYMGKADIERQMSNVQRMKLLGAQVCCVDVGSATLKEAINEALRNWSASYEDTHYCLGSALGPHPYPEIVAHFQSVIGIEARRQIIEACGKLPDILVASVGGGSNAIGLFAPFLGDKDVKMVGVEAGGNGTKIGQHAARFQGGIPGVLHGCYTYLLQDDAGQVMPTHSVSAGLDYPAVGPQHAFLHDSGRVSYDSVKDDEAVEALHILARSEGIIPALESSHALAYVITKGKEFDKDSIIIINLSGRGDKDLLQIEKYRGRK